MMRRFRVGEKARLRYVTLRCELRIGSKKSFGWDDRCYTAVPPSAVTGGRMVPEWQPGLIVTVISNHSGVRPNGGHYDYEVDFPGRPPNAHCRVLHDQLEPLTPPLGDWSVIERATGWNPTKVPA